MAFSDYPPPEHILGDLGMEAELTTESTARVRTRVTPFVTTSDGGVRAGVLATLVDIVGGAIAARVLRPDWMATADMALQLVGPVRGPWVEARGSVTRRGRTTLVIEALVWSVEEDGTDSILEGGTPCTSTTSISVSKTSPKRKNSFSNSLTSGSLREKEMHSP